MYKHGKCHFLLSARESVTIESEEQKITYNPLVSGHTYLNKPTVFRCEI